MALIELRTNVRAASGSTHVATVTQWESCRYGDAQDRNATCELVLPADDPVFPLMRVGYVLNLVTDEWGPNNLALREYRIRNIVDDLDKVQATVTAVPIMHDLNKVFVSAIVGGLETRALSFSQLTITQAIEAFVLPSLTAKGVTWIETGTIDDSLLRSFQWDSLTCLGFLLELTKDNTDFNLELTPNGTTSYRIAFTALNATAPRPQFLVGRNVLVLNRQIDGQKETTQVIPQGAIPNGGTIPTDIAEFAAEITAVDSGAGTVTLADADGGPGTIVFADQDVGLYLDKLIPPRVVWPEDSGLPPSAVGNLSRTAKEAALATSTNQLWVTVLGPGDFTTAGYLHVYDADAELTFVDRITTGGGPWGIAYDVTTDKIFVGCYGDDSVKVYNATTRALNSTIALTAGDTPRKIVRASTGKIYVLCDGNHAVRQITPSSETVTGSVDLGGAAYSHPDIISAGTDRVFVSATSGALIRITPSTLAVSSLVLGIGIGALGYDSDRDELWVAKGTTTIIVDCPSFAVVARPTIFDRVVASMVYDADDGIMVVPGGPGIYYADAATRTVLDQHVLGGAPANPLAVMGWIGCYISAQGRLFAILTSFPPILISLVPATDSWSARREITASVVATQKETIGSPVVPFGVGDLVSFRRTLDGVLVTSLADPAVVAAAPIQIETIFSAPALRGERNYVLNPWLRTTTSNVLAPYWDRKLPSGYVQSAEMVWSSGDSSGWRTFSCQVNGNQAAGSAALALKGLTTGDVLQPGDTVISTATSIGTIASRAVVDGSGHATVAVVSGNGLFNAANDGDPVVIGRSGVTDGNFLVSGKGAVLYPGGSIESQASEISVTFPVPYLPSRTNLWCAVEVMVWRRSFNPSTALKFEIRRQGAVLATAIPSDTFTYSDQATASYTLAANVTITDDQCLTLAVKYMGAQGVLYVRRWWATLGPELIQSPPIEVNANAGALRRAGLARVDELTGPEIAYTVEALEDDRDVPVVRGAVAYLQDPARGIAELPTLIAVDRELFPVGTSSPRKPVVTLSNRPKTLTSELLSRLFGIGAGSSGPSVSPPPTSGGGVVIPPPPPGAGGTGGTTIINNYNVSLRRITVTIQTEAMVSGDVTEFEAPLDASGFLISASANRQNRLQLYATDADRTADDPGRVATDPPTSDILLDVIFAAGHVVQRFTTGRYGRRGDGIRVINRDAPARLVLYGRITALDDPDANRIITDVPPPHTPDQNFTGHVPTDPRTSGVTSWATSGSDPTLYYLTSFGGLWSTTGVGPEIARMEGAGFAYDEFEYWVDLYHESADDAGHGVSLVLCAPNTAIGSWNGFDHLRVNLSRAGSGSQTPNIVQIDSAGASTSLASGSSFSFANNSTRRLIAKRIGTRIELWLADFSTGDNRVFGCSATIPSVLLTQDRLGYHSTKSGGGAGFVGEQFGVDAVNQADAVVTDDILLMPFETIV
jgi:hypothetical protein